MNGANHITGGVVFTGIFASFWDVNIFASPALLFFTAFISVLPDIDHLKSPIGKLFYPIAKYLDRRYGHRTITHSLVCYLALLCVVIFIERIFSEGYTYTLVYCFAYFSHLLFDMMTKQGIPLLYPFKRNPCVLPANPELRLKSSDLKTESLCFAIFIMLGITCQNLFANGFWATYNKSFGTLKHIQAEYKLSETLVNLRFTINKNGVILEDSGLVISAKESNCIVFSNSKFYNIASTDKIIKLVPERTKLIYSTEDIFFNNISIDSLAILITSKPIINLKLQSQNKLSFIKDNKPQHNNSVELEHVFNPVFSFVTDSSNNNILNRIELLNLELSELEKEKNKFFQDKKNLSDSINFISKNIPNMDLYNREKYTLNLLKLRSRAENLQTEISNNSNKISLQLKHLNAELAKNNQPTLNGYIQFLTIK